MANGMLWYSWNPSPRDTLTVLLAEDDATIRLIFGDALKAAGYSVLEASDGAEALKISRAFEGDIDLLLTDLNMPFIIGTDLAQRLVDERPRLKVLIMTGNSIELPLLWLPQVIEKPVHPRVVLRRINQELS